MKIGIIDDGIDSTHPYFKPKGYRMPRGFPKGQKNFTTAKVIVARAFAPRTPKYRYANRAVRSAEVRACNPRRGHRRGQLPDPGAGLPDLGRRAEGLPRQLQGADDPDARLRAERQLAGDRRRHRGRRPGRDGRDQPLDRRGRDRSKQRHRGRRARRGSCCGRRAGGRRRQLLRRTRRRLDHLAGHVGNGRSRSPPKRSPARASWRASPPRAPPHSRCG